MRKLFWSVVALLSLTNFAAAQQHIVVKVFDDNGAPMSNADVAAILKSGAYQDAKFEDGQFTCDPTEQCTYLFVAAPGHEAYMTAFSGVGAVTVKMKPSNRNSVIIRGRGPLPGIDGDVNPILDNLNRTYIYGHKIGFEVKGKPAGQPLHFKINGEIDAVSPQGKRFYICVRGITQEVSILEYTLPN